MSNKINTLYLELINLIRKSIKSKRKNLFLHNPYFDSREQNYLKNCINSTFVATSGEYIKKFENSLKKITKSYDVITVLNGTVALKICLEVLGIKKDEEVLLPSLTFVGTVNAIKHAGGNPHFVDTDINDFGIDYKKLDDYLKKIIKKRGGQSINKMTGKKVFGIIPVHVFGKIGDMNALLKISKRYNLKVVEDAAEALGSYYNNTHAGNFGNLGILSFNANKVITTGSGGAIICNSKKLSLRIRHLVSTAKVSHPWEFLHDAVGWNYKMNNLSSALGQAQIEKFKKITRYKNKLKERYKKNSKKFKNISFFNDPKNCKSNNWLNVIQIKKINLKERNDILNLLNKKHINCRPVWKLMHKLRMYKNSQKSNLSNAIELEKSIICLPSGAEYGKK